ncbi:MAG: sodium-dependent transporter [Opitutaceae bacterium]
MSHKQPAESWNSRLGVILAVSGSAVGLGNFLRFPGQAAQYGGGAFMIAYFVSLLVIGMSICWAEWTLGRYGGRYGVHSSPALFALLIRRPWAKYLGVLGIIIPIGVYMYYVYIEAWCLGYAVNYLTGTLGQVGMDSGAYFARFVGLNHDGFAIGFSLDQVGIFVIAVYFLNYFLIYRGLSRGIELFCKFAMPSLIVIAVIILVRVLTLGAPIPDKPEQSVLAGLGFMWNPGDVAHQLKNPELWMAAAGQIFFSLSVGFGIIATYASYLKDTDDVVLSGLTATSANEFCEVGLGGLITLPAGFVFLGAAGLVGQGTFGLGFNVLPIVFATMPFGAFFGFLFFFLLFLAAVTSSLSMLQPGIAFLEEALSIRRRESVAILGVLTGMGSMFVWYFSQNLKALDTIDFWAGTFFIFIQGFLMIILFSWVMGVERGFEEAHRGAAFRIPDFFKPIMKYVAPAYLMIIFVLWVLFNLLGWNGQFAGASFNPTGYVVDLLGSETRPASTVARLSVGIMILFTVFISIVVSITGKRWDEKFKNLPKGFTS